MSSSLEAVLAKNFTDSDDIALIDGRNGEKLTYRELSLAIEKVEHFLEEKGVSPGQVVSIYSQNSVDYAVIVYGVILYGAIANPLNITWSAHEIDKVISHACPELVFSDTTLDLTSYYGEVIPIDFYRGYSAERAPHSNFKAFDSQAGAILLYTSGTTGVPKGVLLSRKNLQHNLETAKNHLPLLTKHTTMAILPLYHVHGFVSDLSLMLYTGGTTIILPTFDLNILEDIESAVANYEVNSFSAVPFILDVMRSFQVSLKSPSLNFCVSGAAPLKDDLITQYKEDYGIQVIPAYGMTECMNYCTISPSEHIIPGSIGKPVGIEVKIVDEDGNALDQNEIGELVIKGNSVITDGYFKNVSECYLDDENTWFRTGDLGYYDVDGYFYIKGRKKNMVIRGGTKVYLNDLDVCLSQHPDIKDSACIRLEHPEQDKIVSFVVYHDSSAASEQEVMSYLDRFLPKDKLPDVVMFCETIPRTATNKVKLAELQNIAAEKV